jgi:hypothetical protein
MSCAIPVAGQSVRDTGTPTWPRGPTRGCLEALPAPVADRWIHTVSSLEELACLLASKQQTS